MSTPPFPWVARAPGAPETLFDAPLSPTEKSRLHDLIYAVVRRVCLDLGKPLTFCAEIYSAATAKVWFTMRRASRAAWTERDGAVLPVDFWRLGELRNVWLHLKEPPRFVPERRPLVAAPLQRLWVELRQHRPVPSSEVLRHFVEQRAFADRFRNALLVPSVAASLEIFPRSTLLFAATELASGSPGPGPNTDLEFANEAAFSSYLAMVIRTTIFDLGI